MGLTPHTDTLMFAFLRGPSASSFPYELKEPFERHEQNSIWTVFNATKKVRIVSCAFCLHRSHWTQGSKEQFTVFVLRKKQVDASYLNFAKQGAKRLKTTKHPGFLTFIQEHEDDESFYIVTEHCTGLLDLVADCRGSPDIVSCGLYSIVQALAFLASQSIAVCCLPIDLIFVTSAGDWKLGGLEFLTPYEELDRATSGFMFAVRCVNERYFSPEARRQNFSALKSDPLRAMETYALGALIYEIFNGKFLPTISLRRGEGIPSNLCVDFQRLVFENWRERSSFSEFVRSRFFLDSATVYVASTLAEFLVKTDEEKREFLGYVENQVTSLPEFFLERKALPALSSIYINQGSDVALLKVLLLFYDRISDEAFAISGPTIILKAYEKNNRADRLLLLNHLSSYISRIPSGSVNEKIFPAFCSGFSDTSALLRETSIRAVVSLVPFLTPKSINGGLLSCLAAIQGDSESTLRVNTTLCVGMIAGYLQESNRGTVLASAFARALKDKESVVRMAGLRSASSCLKFFSLEVLSEKVIGQVALLMNDSNREVKLCAADVCTELVAEASSRIHNQAVGSADGDVEDKSSGVGFMSAFMKKMPFRRNPGEKSEEPEREKEKEKSNHAPPGASVQRNTTHTLQPVKKNIQTPAAELVHQTREHPSDSSRALPRVPPSEREQAPMRLADSNATAVPVSLLNDWDGDIGGGDWAVEDAPPSFDREREQAAAWQWSPVDKQKSAHDSPASPLGDWNTPDDDW